MSLRVMIVDDQPDVVTSLKELLLNWGHQVEIALSGDEALKVAEKFQPHAVLLDVMMPGMDGYDVSMRLRHIVNYKDCTIIGVTALGDTTHRYQGYDSGFHFYLTKPVEPERIRKILVDLERAAEVDEKRQSGVEALTDKLKEKITGQSRFS